MSEVSAGQFNVARPVETVALSCFSLGAGSGDEVDTFIQKVEIAGGSIFSKPSETDGWMYGAAFADLDGHRWNLLYMDESKIPKR
ncbi:VOC family protein [Paenibacillus arenosi]|uniref:VOC family protein n=1 Tax=Paenibacillus arenosi TaxID=2774142 RepID=UPI001CDB8921|nr:hypothetical protein [Paenibacillus arenosi]